MKERNLIVNELKNNNNMKEIKYEDTEVYRIYKDFLDNPYRMQKRLFEE